MELRRMIPICLVTSLLTVSRLGEAASIKTRHQDRQLDRKHLEKTHLDRLVLEEILERLEARNGNSGVLFKVYYNGKIYTVDGPDWEKHPHSILISDRHGKIVYLGSDTSKISKYENDYYEEEVEYVDLQGGVVMPGFHDIHQHPLEAMSPITGTCKVDLEDDPLMIVQKLKTSSCVNKQFGTDIWLFGHGHSIVKLLEYVRDPQTTKTPRELLDEVVSDRGFVIMETTSHSMWVNSKALELAKITRNSRPIPGGKVMYDENGDPNGILFEYAGQAVMDIALSNPSKEIKDGNYCGLKAALMTNAKYGITSICDARVYWQRLYQDAYKRACSNGDIKIRVVQGLWLYPTMDDESQIQKLKELHTQLNNNNPCSNKMKVQQIKVYMDGLLESTTAKVSEPYLLDLHLPGLADNKGMNIIGRDRLRKYVRDLQDDFDFHIHAIGDIGVKDGLDALEMELVSGTRHRLTHVELVRDEDFRRFRENNVIADFQVAGEFTLRDEENFLHLSSLIGPQRANKTIPVKTMLDSQAKVTFSSDWDVSPLNPFIGIEHATLRADQSVDVKTAVELYTINPAFAMRHENLVGSLRVGKQADFIVIDRDILTPNVDIAATKVTATYVDGEKVFDKATQVDLEEELEYCLNPDDGVNLY